MIYLAILIIIYCAYKEYETNKQIKDLTTKLLAKDVNDYLTVKNAEENSNPPEIDEENPFQELDEIPQEDIKRALNKKGK